MVALDVQFRGKIVRRRCANIPPHDTTERNSEMQANPITQTCSVEGCERKPFATGICQLHYTRVLRHGSVDVNRSRVRGVCAVEGCSRPHDAHGYCRNHAERFRLYGDPLGLSLMRSAATVRFWTKDVQE